MAQKYKCPEIKVLTLQDFTESEQSTDQFTCLYKTGIKHTKQ